MNENQDESNFEVRFHSDGTYSIVVRIDTEAEVLETALKAEEFSNLKVFQESISQK